MLLERILEDKRREIGRRQIDRPLRELERTVASMPPPRDFLSALRQPDISVIAEVKRRSPSRGAIRPELDAAALARRYEAGGAAAISVLTEAAHFGAREGDAGAIRASTRLPVLRKDFVLCEYQVFETRSMGADAVLLIARALQRDELRHLVALAISVGLCPLVEIHSDEEAEAALRSGAPAIGINNRDLDTFQVSLETTRRLLRLLPPDVAVVSESGISSEEDARLARSWGADAVLVGEALVLSPDPAEAIRRMRAACSALPDRRQRGAAQIGGRP